MSAFGMGVLSRNVLRYSLRALPKPGNVRFLATIASKKKSMSTAKLLMIGVGVGGTAGAGWSGYLKTVEDKENQQFKMQEMFGPPIIDKKPDNLKIMRQIVNPKDNTGLDLVLFQFQTCPFCCKVRSFLDYSGLSYSVVEVDAVLRQSIKWSNTKKVPIMLARMKDGRYVQLTDSSMIISVLASYMLDQKTSGIEEVARFYPYVSFTDVWGSNIDIANKYFLMFQDKKPKQSKEEQNLERKWRSWADNRLVHLISPNVYRTWDEALETFEWFSDIGKWNEYFPSWERNLMVYVGTLAMYLISKRLTKKHNLGEDVRAPLYEACNDWIEVLEKKKTKFLGGSEPNIADISVYGVLCSMEGCQAFKDCLENTRIQGWFNSVKEIVEKNRGNRVLN